MLSSPLSHLALFLGLAFGTHAAAQTPSYTPFGNGCAGRLGVPILEAGSNSLPMLGTTFRAQLRRVPDGTSIGILGDSTTNWVGLSLPLDLTSVGMPGCNLFINCGTTVNLANFGGRASWDMVMSNDPALLGISFFQQVLVFDTTMPGLHAVMSNAAEGVIGDASPAPVATIAFPPANSQTNHHAILVRGNATDPDGVAEVRVNGLLAATSDGFANWQVSVPIVLGSNTLTVEATDTLGEHDAQAATAQVLATESPTFLPPPDPEYLAVDPARNRVLVTDTGRAAIFAIDLTTGEDTIFSSGGLGASLFRPNGIVLDGTRALVVDAGRRSLIAMDLDTGETRVLSDANTGTGPKLFAPTGISLTATHAYVTDRTLRRVFAINLSSGNRTVASSDSVGTGPRFASPWGIAIDGMRALVMDWVLNAVIAIDLPTGNRSVLSSNSVGTGPMFGNPIGIAVDGTRALVTDQVIGGVIAVDLLTGNRTILSGPANGTGPDFAASLDISLDGTRALVTDPSLKAIFEVDLTTGNRSMLFVSGLEEGPALDQGTGPSFEAASWVAQDGTRTLVVDAFLRAVVAVDLATGNRTILSDDSKGTGPGFSSPQGIAIDGNRMLVADNLGFLLGSNIVAVDLATGDRTVISSNSIGTGPSFVAAWGIAMDGNRLLVTDPLLSAVFAVNLTTGDRSIIANPNHGQGPVLALTIGIAVDGNRALVTDRSRNIVFAVNLFNGNRSTLSSNSVGTGPLFSTPTGIRIDPLGNRALMTTLQRATVTDPGTGAVIAVDLATGDRTLISSALLGNGPLFENPVAIALHGSVALVTDNEVSESTDRVIAVDLVTGERVILSR